MAKSIHNDLFDAALNYLKNNGNELTLCSQEPTSYEEAHTTYKLADVALDTGDYIGPVDGTVSGRKITTNQQADVPVDATGTGTHVAIVDTNNSKLLMVSTCNSIQVTSGNNVTIPQFSWELRDPS